MKMKIVIVGTGDEASGLCNMHYCYGNKESYQLVVTEPLPDVKLDEFLHDTEVPIVNWQEAILGADLVVLAIPAKFIKSFLHKHYDDLCDGSKILVDLSNSYKAGEDIGVALQDLGIVAPWVRAFSDNGAINLMSQKPSTKAKLVTEICGKEEYAVEQVKSFAQDGLGFSVKVVPFDRYKDILSIQKSIGTEWILSTVILLVIFILAEIYALVRYNHWKRYDWYHLLLQVTNKAICWTAIYGFALAQVPGVLVKLGDVFRASKARKVSPVLLSWLKLRKHLGLLSLYFLFVHVTISLLLFNPAYYGKFFNEKGKLNWIGEASFFCGILGFSFYAIMGIASLPSVGSAMNKAQWQLVMGPLVWIALALATAHVMIMGVKGWSKQETWPGNMPPITLVSVLVPLTAMFLKLVLVVLTMGEWLYKAIRGKSGNKVSAHPEGMEMAQEVNQEGVA